MTLTIGERAQPDADLRHLFDHHRRELLAESAIDPEVVAERGYATIGRPTANDHRPRQQLANLGFPTWAINEDRYFPGLVIPMYRATGDRISAQWKPRVPVPNRDGKTMKYASVKGQTNRIDVHPRNRDRIIDPTVPLWATEGIKKADSLTSRGCCAIALTGVFNWRSQLGTLGDWEDIPLKGRTVVICFDADARTNPNVLRAMVRFGRWLKSKGVKKVLYLITPSAVNGAATKGVDDYFAAGGTLEDLKAAATPTEPNTDTADDTFSDARLAETISDDVLADGFCWCAGLGWMRWDGRRWDECTDATVGEAVRQYALGRFAEVLAGVRSGDGQAGNTNAIDGWRSMLSAGRQRSVLMLARGIVERRADDFDADPDLLNCPNGVVDLRTGELLPHDPTLLMTKMTSGAYRPGYRHPDWDQALTALPEDVRDWYQVRMGQAITGHRTPDGVLLILQGGGENGKSALTTDGAVPALGGYAAAASPKLFLSTKNEHSTERADLRGQRLVVAEELTEGRSIDVTALKQIQDVARIKARKTHKDNIEFRASHSLMTTTNYIPIVGETDWGTWRRLALVRFPYTYRKPGQPLVDDNDRHGDPGLKSRIENNVSGQHDAIVTWAVEGALRWYIDRERADAATAAGEDPGTSVFDLPDRVARDTRAWRAEADRILGFWTQRLIPDSNACVLTVEMLEVFNDWLAANGHNKWPKETFGPRFEGHQESQRHRVTRRRTTKLGGLRRAERSPYAEPITVPKQPEVWQGVRFRTDMDADPEGGHDQG